MSTETSPKEPRPLLGTTLSALVLLYLLGVGVIVAGASAFGGGGNSTATSASTTASISLTEFSISGTLQVPSGKVTLAVKNDGTVEHNLTIPSLGKATKNIGPGASESIVLSDLKAGTYEVFCSVAGHKDSGMKANLVVSNGSAGAPAAAASGMNMGSGGTGNDMTPAQAAKMDDAMMKQMASFGTDAVATKGVGNQPLVPTIAADGTKEFTVTAAITKWEVEKGKIVDAWTYNGQVPGPWIKVNVGDKVRVNLINKLPVASDIHFHGIHVPNSQDGVAPYTQDLVKPNGGTFSYSFVADKPALGMYHAHMHGEQAVPNGMFGVFEIGDIPLPGGRTVSGVAIPKDVRPVLEQPMVLNDSGAIGFSLNGKSFPSTAPVVVNLGDWFTVNYFNEGLMSHPMHMHGFPQLIVAKDGIPLDQPYWADTILIGPGERYSVLVHATDPGVWVWHCHILNHVEMKDRLFGMASAVIVKDPNAKPASKG